MLLNCPQCEHEFSIAEGAPRFCSQCGEPLSEFIESSTATGLSAVASDATLPPKEPTKFTAAADETVTRNSGHNYAVPDSDANDSQVGPYALIDKLGQGGMGTVYEAVNEETGQRVALKLLSRSLRGTEESVQRFRRESQIAASINHPRSTFVYEAGQHEGQFFITMELMPGGTLKELVVENGQIEIGTAVDYILDIIDGLKVAHEAGIVHRDLKPSNCFVDDDDRIKIGDFGLAKSFVTDSSLTQTGAFMGTPQYAAPEQMRAADVDARTDIYAIGGTLFYLLCARPPFAGNAAQVIASIASEVPPLVTKFNKEVPRELAGIIAQTLEKDPEKRQENLQMLRSALLPFSTRGASLADVGRRLAAFFMDVLVASAVSSIGTQVLMFTMMSMIESDTISLHTITMASVVFQTVIAISYFALCEWKYGRTIGKWLMGMRVIDKRAEPPRLHYAFLRALLIPGASMFVSLIPTMMIDFTPGNSFSWAEFVKMTVRSYGASLLGFIPTILLLSTARAKNGFRGVHDVFTGTRVVRIGGELESQRLDRIPITAPVRTSDLQTFGSFQSVARFNDASQPFSIVMGRDRELDRNVWVFRGDGAIGKYDGNRKSITRPCRLRILSEGTDNGGWHATDAVHGTPVIDVWKHRKLCPWQSVRHNFSELARELGQAIEEETLPQELSLSQVWIDQSGRVKLIDRPVIRNGSGNSAEDRATEYVDRRENSRLRAGRLFNELLRAYAAWHDVPMHVIEFQREFENRLNNDSEGKIDHFQWAERELAEFADRASKWHWDDRLGLLAVAFGLELPIYIFSVMVLGVALSSSIGTIPGWLVGMLVTATGCLLALVLGFFLRGGVAIKISGIEVCRRSIKRRASRLRCGIRNMFVWSPFILFFACIVMIVRLAFAEVEASNAVDGLTISAMGKTKDQISADTLVPIFALFPLMLVIVTGFLWALVKPSRGLPDLIAGTELIRK